MYFQSVQPMKGFAKQNPRVTQRLSTLLGKKEFWLHKKSIRYIRSRNSLTKKRIGGKCYQGGRTQERGRINFPLWPRFNFIYMNALATCLQHATERKSPYQWLLINLARQKHPYQEAPRHWLGQHVPQAPCRQRWLTLATEEPSEGSWSIMLSSNHLTAHTYSKKRSRTTNGILFPLDILGLLKNGFLHYSSFLVLTVLSVL